MAQTNYLISEWSYCGYCGFGVKSGLIPDDHVFGSWVARRQMFQKQAARFQTHFRQTQKFRRILPVHFQGRVEVSPFVFSPIRHGRTHAPQRPAFAHHGDQTVAVFIGHPQVHRPSTSHIQARQLCAERVLELFGCGRVFLRVGLARHLQDPAQFSQPVIHPGQLQTNPVTIPQPVLDFLGPLPLARLQSGQQFGQDGALHLGRGPATVLTLQQSGHTAGLERIHPVEETAAADAQLLGNLRRRHLATGGQTRGKQPLLAFHIPASSQLDRHSLRQIRPVQVVSLRHVPLCLHPQNSAISNWNWQDNRKDKSVSITPEPEGRTEPCPPQAAKPRNTNMISSNPSAVPNPEKKRRYVVFIYVFHCWASACSNVLSMASKELLRLKLLPRSTVNWPLALGRDSA